MTDLPAGWERTTLGEIAETSLGKMLDRGTFTGSNAVPYLRNINVQWGRFDLEDILTIEIPPERRSFFELRPGDLMVCEGGAIGRCAVWPGSKVYMAFQKALHRVRPCPGVDAHFLRYLLEHYSHTNALVPYSTGSTIKHLPQQQLRRVLFPLPPYAEQRRIVTALDLYLPRLQSATTSLRAASAKVDLLVATARHDATMAFANDTQRLGDLLMEVEAGKSFAAEGRPANPDEWGIIKISAMTWGEFRPNENKAVPRDHEIDIRHEIRSGDILISRANTEKYVGAAVLVRETRAKLLLSDKSLRLVPKQSVDPMWLTEVLASPAVRSQISGRATGMKDSMRNISQKALREIRVPCATPEQQARAVETLSGLRVETSRLRSQVYATERRQDLLRASLLRDAFAGRLEPQDPNDEPASVILERIKAEWAKQPKPRRGGRAAKRTNPDQERML